MSTEILTTTEKVNQIKVLKNKLAENLTAMGVPASTDEGLDTLVPKVLDGVMYGTFKTDAIVFDEDTKHPTDASLSNARTVTITGAPFEPKIIEIFSTEAASWDGWTIKEISENYINESILLCLNMDTSSTEKWGAFTVARRNGTNSGDYVADGNKIGYNSKILHRNGNDITITFDAKFRIYFAPNKTYHYVLKG